VHFLRITRKPPVFGYTSPDETGQFSVFLNGVPGVFPNTPPLNLPAAGGSAPLNLCKTVDMNGADRLQLIFVNSLGGAVWSQFATNTKFGAGPGRTMTTGRQVVVPGLPGPPDPVTGKPAITKPQTLQLREFELLYTIEYHAPPNTLSPGTGTRAGVHTGGLTGRPGLVLDPGTPPAQPCRKI
jgi:hypothetical protein